MNHPIGESLKRILLKSRISGGGATTDMVK
jgi:hypothetical protein